MYPLLPKAQNNTPIYHILSVCEHFLSISAVPLPVSLPLAPPPPPPTLPSPASHSPFKELDTSLRVITSVHVCIHACVCYDFIHLRNRFFIFYTRGLPHRSLQLLFAVDFYSHQTMYPLLSKAQNNTSIDHLLCGSFSQYKFSPASPCPIPAISLPIHHLKNVGRVYKINHIRACTFALPPNQKDCQAPYAFANYARDHCIGTGVY